MLDLLEKLLVEESFRDYLISESVVLRAKHIKLTLILYSLGIVHLFLQNELFGVPQLLEDLEEVSAAHRSSQH